MLYNLHARENLWLCKFFTLTYIHILNHLSHLSFFLTHSSTNIFLSPIHFLISMYLYVCYKVYAHTYAHQKGIQDHHTKMDCLYWQWCKCQTEMKKSLEENQCQNEYNTTVHRIPFSILIIELMFCFVNMMTQNLLIQKEIYDKAAFSSCDGKIKKIKWYHMLGCHVLTPPPPKQYIIPGSSSYKHFIGSLAVVFAVMCVKYSLHPLHIHIFDNLPHKYMNASFMHKSVFTYLFKMYPLLI